MKTKLLKSVTIFTLSLTSGFVYSDNTTITSEQLEMTSKEEGNHFEFKNNVHVITPEFEATCDLLTVDSLSTSKSPTTKSQAPAMGSIDSIIATGNVKINQGDRRAEAGKAIINPKTGVITLENDPVVYDKESYVTGYRIVFKKNDKKAYVEGGPNGERSKVVLPELEGFETKVSDDDDDADTMLAKR